MLEPQQLGVILNHIGEAILLLDGEGVVRLTNSRLEALIGLPLNRLQNQPVLHLLDDPELRLAHKLGYEEDSLRLLIYELQMGKPLPSKNSVEYQVLAPYRRFIHRLQVPMPAPKGEKAGLLLVFSDQTEAHELRQTQDEISSMIVHDLRSPLAAVTASLRLLKDFAEPTDPLGKVVLQTTEIAGRAVRKLLNLVNSLLDVSKMESGVQTLEREPTELGALIRAVLDELRPLADEMEVELDIVGIDALPLLDIDADKMERVLYNLVDNAIKFTPSRGQVVIRADNSDGQLLERGFLRVEVCDSGPGIPQDYRERLFDRYQQLEGKFARRRGTGLGLTFCKLAVEAHGGQIWIEDNPTGGSVFAFTVPIYRDSLNC